MAQTSRFVVAAVIAVFSPIAISPALAAASSPQQATVQGFVGTWSCITHSSDNKTYRETDVDSMFGDWLRIDSTYPAQGGAPAGTGVTFLGYDSKHARWIVTGVGTDGSYFTSVSMSPAFDGSKWTDQYPNDHGTAVLHMPTATQYTMDMQAPSSQGKMTSQHAICTKQ
jgi:hypothetical protein